MKDLDDMWKNPKYNSLLKLLLWVIFFIVIYSIIILSNNITIRRNEIESVNTSNENKLLDLKYNKLQVKYDLKDYYIEGIVERGVFNGTIEYTDGTIYKIKYDGNNISKISDIDSSEEYILISFNNKYLLPSYIIDLCKNNAPFKIENGVYSYMIDDVEYEIMYTEKEVHQINIIKDNEKTILEYNVLN